MTRPPCRFRRRRHRDLDRRLIVRSTRQRFVRDIGRASTISTRSPTLHVLFSSCALYFTRRVTNLWKRRSRTRRMTVTTTVLSIFVGRDRAGDRAARAARRSAVSGASRCRLMTSSPSSLRLAGLLLRLLLDARAARARRIVRMRAMSRRLVMSAAVDVTWLVYWPSWSRNSSSRVRASAWCSSSSGRSRNCSRVVGDACSQRRPPGEIELRLDRQLVVRAVERLLARSRACSPRPRRSRGPGGRRRPSPRRRPCRYPCGSRPASS